MVSQTSSCSWATKTISEQRRVWRAGHSCSAQVTSAHSRHNSSVPCTGRGTRTSPMPSLTSRHSHGRTFLQGSLEGLEPEDLLQCFPDPALQARGSLPAHPKAAANEESELDPDSVNLLSPRPPPATCTASLPQGLPATLPLFSGLSGIQTPPHMRGAQCVYWGSVPSSWGTAERAGTGGASAPTEPARTRHGGDCGGSFSPSPLPSQGPVSSPPPCPPSHLRPYRPPPSALAPHPAGAVAAPQNDVNSSN